MIDWPAKCAKMEAETCGDDIAELDYVDKPTVNPRMIRWSVSLSFILWTLIWFGVQYIMEKW